MVPQYVSCIATGKLFVGIGKKKLPTVTPLALCSSQEFFRGKCIFSKSKNIHNYEFLVSASRIKIFITAKNTDPIAGLRIFVAIIRFY